MAEGHTQKDLGAGHSQSGASLPPFKKLPQKAPDISVDRRPDGTVYLWANQPPGERPRSIPHLLNQRAAEHPERPYLRQRLPASICRRWSPSMVSRPGTITLTTT